MLARIRLHLRSNVVGYLALFIALSGSAYAAGLANNSVKSKHIKDGQVKSADVRNNGLTGNDIKEASLGEVPLADAATTADSAASADDAELLDGLNSSAFVQGGGTAKRFYSFGAGADVSHSISGFAFLSLYCASGDLTMQLQNLGAEPALGVAGTGGRLPTRVLHPQLRRLPSPVQRQ